MAWNSIIHCLYFCLLVLSITSEGLIVEKTSLGFAKENGSFICQKCGCRFIPKGNEVICGHCINIKQTPQFNFVRIGEPFRWYHWLMVLGLFALLVIVGGSGGI